MPVSRGRSNIRTAADLLVRVGDDMTPLHLSTAAVEVVQTEAARQLVEALADARNVEKAIEVGDGLADLTVLQLAELHGHLRMAVQLAEVLIDCRPLEDAGPDQ